MHVLVTGASGNIGTALLRALRGRRVTGLAERPPAPDPPYDVTWVAADLADPYWSAERLAELVGGVDAVVHLAWAIQPSHHRDLIREINVGSATRVAQACAMTGVHLVVVSSVGAYQPAPDHAPRDETWPVGELVTSSYSVDKVAVERMLDRVQRAHPDLRVTRVRPQLVFQRAAASGIERYFLGPAAPAAVLRRQLPVLPWPSGVRLQAVHADDLATALVAVLDSGATGPFNIAAPDVLGPQDVADQLSGGRWVAVPHAAVRRAVALAWQARAAALEPGWLDLAAGVPVLDAGRARRELGWRPPRTTRESFAELVAGLADGAGGTSAALRPRAASARSVVGGQIAER